MNFLTMLLSLTYTYVNGRYRVKVPLRVDGVPVQ